MCLMDFSINQKTQAIQFSVSVAATFCAMENPVTFLLQT